MKNSKLILYKYESYGNIEDVRKYITARYYRFLDYANFHGSQAGIADEANDILNETLLSLFSRDFELLVKLYRTKKAQYCELDFFVLRMIKLNCYSATAPYRNKYKSSVKIDTDVDFSTLRIEAPEDDEPIDKAGETLRQYRLVMYVADALNLTDFERDCWEFRFVHNLPHSQWDGPEPKRVLYETYNMVRDSIHEALYRHQLTALKPSTKTYYGKTRRRELVQEFLSTRKIHLKREHQSIN